MPYDLFKSSEIKNYWAELMSSWAHELKLGGAHELMSLRDGH